MTPEREISRTERTRSTDMERGIKAAIKNGVGTVWSRSIVILVIPVLTIITTLGGWVVNLELDAIAKDIHAVVDTVAVVRDTVAGMNAQLSTVRADVTRLQVGAAAQAAKTESLEQRLTDARMSRR